MIYDISPALTQDIAVWPGDSALSRETLLDLERGDNLTLSTLRTTVHLGAHADAPNHYGAGAPDIASRDLTHYLGRCRVQRVDVPRGSRIGIADLPEGLTAERLLLVTGTYPDPARFDESFAALEPALVRALNDRGTRLIGIDTPSVDVFDSKALPAHQAFLERDMAILEGLVLHHVPDGEYELIALPLKLVGFDASPVRAVLRDLG